MTKLKLFSWFLGGGLVWLVIALIMSESDLDESMVPIFVSFLYLVAFLSGFFSRSSKGRENREAEATISPLPSESDKADAIFNEPNESPWAVFLPFLPKSSKGKKWFVIVFVLMVISIGYLAHDLISFAMRIVTKFFSFFGCMIL